MYSGEPTAVGRGPPASGSWTSAPQKSNTLGTPSKVSMMLLGLMSRWSTPRECE